MPKPEVIGSKRSSYTRVVRMACEEKGIDYVFTEALLGAPEIFAIHPFGKMPVMRHGDVELFESKAIATYFDRCFSGAFPVSVRTCTGCARRAMGLARQYAGRSHPNSHLSARLCCAEDRRMESRIARRSKR